MKATIRLALMNGADREVSADVFGNWAAHRSLEGNCWKVTHVPSGTAATLAFTRNLSEADALRIAIHLHETGTDFPVSADELRQSAMNLRKTGERDKRLSQVARVLEPRIREALGKAVRA